jgi:hypothetical protein
MAGKRIAEAVRVAVRRLQDTGASDANLLARYATDRNEAAFAELVCRHSAMVKGVARRVLLNEQDAEDVFGLPWPKKHIMRAHVDLTATLPRRRRRRQEVAFQEVST